MFASIVRALVLCSLLAPPGLPAGPPRTDLGEPKAKDAQQRLFLIKANGYVNVGSLSAPGYYTLIIFSAPWCVPCAEVHAHARDWLERYQNLVIVDLDIGTKADVDPKGAAILADLDRKVVLPAALLLNPFGLYINASRNGGIAPPVSGAPAIIEAMNALAARTHKQIIPLEPDPLRRLRSLSKKTTREK